MCGCHILTDKHTESVSRHPSVSLHVQILNKIQMFQLFKLLISATPHMLFQTEQWQLQCSYTKSYGFPTSQVLKLHPFAIFKRSGFLLASQCVFFPHPFGYKLHCKPKNSNSNSHNSCHHTHTPSVSYFFNSFTHVDSCELGYCDQGKIM